MQLQIFYVIDYMQCYTYHSWNW